MALGRDEWPCQLQVDWQAPNGQFRAKNLALASALLPPLWLPEHVTVATENHSVTGACWAGGEDGPLGRPGRT
jgi:hypothetical protein